MFNAPRPSQNYGVSSTNGFGGSFVNEDPLAGSAYDGLDPWSTAPSPAPPSLPTISSATSGASAIIGSATVPAVYYQAFAAVDIDNVGETSVNGLSRVLVTSSLSASTIEKIVSLVSSHPKVSKYEFYVALALVALAQSGKDVSIERVATLAQEDALPSPALELNAITSSNSTFTSTVVPYSNFPNYPDIHAPVPTRGYSSEDPWSTNRFAPSASQEPVNGAGAGGAKNGAPSSIAGTGLPKDWWKKQEVVNVNVLGQQGFILNRYLVYEVSTERSAPVPRRYSEFVVLWDCLVRRYPFRLLPALPPKRIGPDEGFLEQRRRGLSRFINFVVNHPVIKDDGMLAVFLTEPSFDAWRKNTLISYDEESVGKRVDQIEEMSIPSDLEDKLAVARAKLPVLIDQWQKICLLAERMIKRREAAAVRIPPPLRPTFLPSHFPFSPAVSVSPVSSSPPATSAFSPSPSNSMTASMLYRASSSASSSADSIASSTASTVFNAVRRTRRDEPQADLARLTNTLKAVVEVNEQCWRGTDCELCSGVQQGLSHVTSHIQTHADNLEHRARVMLYSTLEALKGQRDLYISLRDLFIRRDRLSGDQVDRMRKRVEMNSLKLEGVKQAKKDRWEEEADRVTGLIEKDHVAIQAALNRRVFIRACMWHELRVVLHNRENTLVTQAVRAFAKEEQEFTEGAAANWASLTEAVENMPYE